MYERILVTLDTTPTDRAIIDHIIPLARVMRSHIVLLHVADGWAARTFGPDAVSPEVTEDTAYLQSIRNEFLAVPIPTDAFLAFGDPVKEIVRYVHDHHCDLLAMSTHGHRFLADLVLGVTATRVQHRLDIPVLLLRAR